MKVPKQLGQCFDATALMFVVDKQCAKDQSARLCHGIGVANYPARDCGKPMAHAWIEKGGQAYDCVNEVQCPASVYRRELLQISYVVEYTLAEAWKHWFESDMPGPWCPKIQAVIK